MTAAIIHGHRGITIFSKDFIMAKLPFFIYVLLPIIFQVLLRFP